MWRMVQNLIIVMLQHSSQTASLMTMFLGMMSPCLHQFVLAVVAMLAPTCSRGCHHACTNLFSRLGEQLLSFSPPKACACCPLHPALVSRWIASQDEPSVTSSEAVTMARHFHFILIDGTWNNSKSMVARLQVSHVKRCVRCGLSLCHCRGGSCSKN